MMVATPRVEKPRPLHPILQVFWYIGCILTLGYAPKYLRQIEEWQVPSIYDELSYSTVDAKRLGLLSLRRFKQQKEWDRLMIPLSIMTVTSAAALAIPSLHWLSSALYTAAFGLSLEGLLITTYLTVFKSSSTEMLGRLANGRTFLKRLTAIVIALPAALTTYAALFLLGGLLVMTGAATSENSITEHNLAFRAIGLAPVCITFVCLVVAIIGCEAFIWMDANHAQMGDAEPEGLPFSVEKVPDGRY